jgi:hypothetical protein
LPQKKSQLSKRCKALYFIQFSSITGNVFCISLTTAFWNLEDLFLNFFFFWDFWLYIPCTLKFYNINLSWSSFDWWSVGALIRFMEILTALWRLTPVGWFGRICFGFHVTFFVFFRCRFRSLFLCFFVSLFLCSFCTFLLSLFVFFFVCFFLYIFLSLFISACFFSFFLFVFLLFFILFFFLFFPLCFDWFSFSFFHPFCFVSFFLSYFLWSILIWFFYFFTRSFFLCLCFLTLFVVSFHVSLVFSVCLSFFVGLFHYW